LAASMALTSFLALEGGDDGGAAGGAAGGEGGDDGGAAGGAAGGDDRHASHKQVYPEEVQELPMRASLRLSA